MNSEMLYNKCKSVIALARLMNKRKESNDQIVRLAYNLGQSMARNDTRESYSLWYRLAVLINPFAI